MKKFFFTLLVFFGFIEFSNSQQDTIRDINQIDSVYSNLDTNFLNNYLLDRSWIKDENILQQKKGNYNQIFDGISYLYFLSAINASKLNSNTVENGFKFVADLQNFADSLSDPIDRKNKVPFGFALVDMNYIDTSTINSGGVTFENGKVTPNIDQSKIYKNFLACSAAPLDFSGSFSKGQKLYFDNKFFFKSKNIEIQSMKIDLGKGSFESVVIGQSIDFPDYKDSLKGFLKVNYLLDSVENTQIIEFYVYTEKNTKEEKNAKNSGPLYWGEEEDLYLLQQEGIVFKLNILPRCGYNESNPDHKMYYSLWDQYLPKLKRPVILVSPYSPWAQGQNDVTTVTLYNQFNTWGLFEELSDLGYDIIVVETENAHKSVARCGRDFGRLLGQINDWKRQSYPDEDWENTIIGFSMGGQVAKYALKWLEHKHMLDGVDHHHSRLYISYDSPHHGGRIPMGFQSVFHSWAFTGSIPAVLSYSTLCDDGSKSMIEPHIQPNISNFGPINREVVNSNSRTDLRSDLLDDLTNNLQHPKSYTSDERITFPSFTRNVAVSMGSYLNTYTDQYLLTPGQKYYEHTLLLSNSYLYASLYGNNQPAYSRYDIISGSLYSFVTVNEYETSGILEWDIAKGGFKNDFYRLWFGPIPLGAVSILQHQGLGGNTHYEGDISFMPLVSSLSINPTYWQNNNMSYNPQDEGLMYQKFNYDPIDDKSNFFGYPNLVGGNHFEITPFEAIYADEITYEHIKPINTIGTLSANDPTENYAKYLDSIKNFIVREVEDEMVYLQNYRLGWNHNNWTPESEYKAWYKAEKEVHLGEEITPKTDVGKYIVTDHGNLTVYAGEKVVMKPGFEARYGSYYKAYIDPLTNQCVFPKSNLDKTKKQFQSMYVENNIAEMEERVKTSKVEVNETETILIYPNPNNSNFTIQLPGHQSKGYVVITDLSGRKIDAFQMNNNTFYYSNKLVSGIYILKLCIGKEEYIEKIIVQ